MGVSVDGIAGTGSAADVRTVAAAMRAGAAASVSQANPTRARFDLPNSDTLASRRTTTARAGGGIADPAASSGQDAGAATATARNGTTTSGGNGGAFAGFLAQSMAQDSHISAPSSALLAASSAYRKASPSPTRPMSDTIQVLVPPLASGHSLDLVI
jgi:hypothetical protein